MKFINILSIILLPTLLFSQSELENKKLLLSQKQKILVDYEQKILNAQEENSKAKEYLNKIDKQKKDKQFDYENKKSAFDRASKNVDLVSPTKLNQLSEEYKLADKDLRETDVELNKAQIKEQETSKKLKQIMTEKEQTEKDIMALKADIFDIQLREPVWTVGESICNLSEDETPDQCRKRALESAQRDAMEKGGKMILESETIVRNYQLYLDEIKTHLKAQIMEQDNDPQYGVKREILGNNIRYVAKLRLKVQSISEYNPYRNELKKSSKENNINIVWEKVITQLNVVYDSKIELSPGSGVFITNDGPGKIKSFWAEYSTSIEPGRKQAYNFVIERPGATLKFQLISGDSAHITIIKL